MLRNTASALSARTARKNQAADDWLGAIRNADLVAVRGGVSIHAHAGTVRSDLGFLERMSPLLAARAAHKPIVLLGSQIGPFTRFARVVFGRVASGAIAIARDAVSLATLQQTIGSARVIGMPDTVFALQNEHRDVRSVLTSRGVDPSQRTAALVISTAVRPEEGLDLHVELFVRAARSLLEAQQVTQIIVVVQAEEDRFASERLAARLGLDTRSVIDDDLDPQQLIALYGLCDLVVSSRLHAVILAFIAGTPAVSLAPAVTFKERAVLGSIGLEDYCVQSSDAPELLGEICVRVAQDRLHHAARIQSVVETARDAMRKRIPAFLLDSLRPSSA